LELSTEIDNTETNYYAIIDIMEFSEKAMGTPLLAGWEKHTPPLSFVFTLRPVFNCCTTDAGLTCLLGH